MSNSARSSKSPAHVSPSSIIAALVLGSDHPKDLADLLALADARLPKLVENRDGLGPCPIQEAAHEMINASRRDDGWQHAIRSWRETLTDDTNAVNYETAMASFLLGFVAGTKLSGAR